MYRSSALSHPIWVSFSFNHVLPELCQRTPPSGQRWAPSGSIQWSLFIMAFPDLSPVASQNVQPRSWAWRLHGTGGFALISEPCVVGGDITWKQLGQSSRLSNLPTSPWGAFRSLPLNSLWSGHCERMTTTQDRKNKNRNLKITMATLTRTGLFNELSRLADFFCETKSTFALSKSTWILYFIMVVNLGRCGFSYTQKIKA